MQFIHKGIFTDTKVAKHNTSNTKTKKQHKMHTNIIKRPRKPGQSRRKDGWSCIQGSAGKKTEVKEKDLRLEQPWPEVKLQFSHVD